MDAKSPTPVAVHTYFGQFSAADPRCVGGYWSLPPTAELTAEWVALGAVVAVFGKLVKRAMPHDVRALVSILSTLLLAAVWCFTSFVSACPVNDLPSCC